MGASNDRPSNAVLQHYGIKGMRWGVRRKEGADGRVAKSNQVKSRSGSPILLDEGSGQYKTARGTPVAADAVVARARQAQAKAQGSDSLSTKELQELVNRMNLEKQYDGLNPATMNKGLELAMNLGKVVVPIVGLAKLADAGSKEDLDPKTALAIEVGKAVLMKMASGGGKKKK